MLEILKRTPFDSGLANPTKQFLTTSISLSQTTSSSNSNSNLLKIAAAARYISAYARLDNPLAQAYEAICG
jgi:hypothetical protein